MRLWEFIGEYRDPVVYHGSTTSDIKRLEPSESKLTSVPVVFAAILDDVAIAMAGGWSDDDFEFGRMGQETDGYFTDYQFTEKKPGAFLQFFSQSIFLYLLPSEGFSTIEGLQDFELVSESPVEPISFLEITQPLTVLKQSKFIKLVEFNPSV